MTFKLTIEGETWDDVRAEAKRIGAFSERSEVVPVETEAASPPVAKAALPVLIGAAPGTPPPPVIVPTNTPINPAAVPTVADAVPGVPELDSEGLPWDERIHTKNRGKNKTGSWKGRRNTDKALVAKVRADLFAAQQGAPPVGAPAPVGVPGAPDVAATIKLASDILVAGGTPEGMQKLGAELHRVMIENGLPNGQTDLINRPDLAPVIHAALMRIVATNGLACG